MRIVSARRVSTYILLLLLRNDDDGAEKILTVCRVLVLIVWTKP
jgi:hypothetical protein